MKAAGSFMIRGTCFAAQELQMHLSDHLTLTFSSTSTATGLECLRAGGLAPPDRSSPSFAPRTITTSPEGLDRVDGARVLYFLDPKNTDRKVHRYF